MFSNYYPQKVDDFLKNQELKDVFKLFSQNGRIPNIILTGHSGCGKNTYIRMLLKQENIKDKKIYEIDALDIKNIDMIKKYSGRAGHKIILIFIDKIDSAIQKTLNIIMNMSLKCSFIFVTKEIETPLESFLNKCFVLSFRRIPKATLFEHFKQICTTEKVEIGDKKLEQIIEYSNGDFRNVFNQIKIHEDIDFQYEELLDEILFSPNDDIYKINKTIELYEMGYTCNDILISLSTIIKNKLCDHKKQCKIFDLISKIQININEGIDTLTQLLFLINEIINYLRQ